MTPQAHGAAGFSASCEPTTINYPALTQITCTLVVTTGDQEERFSVSPRAPQFGGEGMDAEFATLSSNGRLALVGPGELGLGAYAFPSVAACSFLERGWHGAVNGSGKTDVTIPPDSQASLVATYQAQEPPWPGDSLAPLFEISNEMVSGDESTLPAPLTVRTAEPARTGVSGVRIVFATRPESGRRPGP
ncbi:MAG: hypothetical protein M3O25_10265, partial [Actinomycetota bacterium]|nr:hypothetical protein [Actinomycetota bacterium]